MSVQQYAVLGLCKLFHPTKLETDNAYKRLVLQLHTDKDPNKPKATYQELTSARKAVLAHIAAREALLREDEDAPPSPLLPTPTPSPESPPQQPSSPPKYMMRPTKKIDPFAHVTQKRKLELRQQELKAAADAIKKQRMTEAARNNAAANAEGREKVLKAKMEREKGLHVKLAMGGAAVERQQRWDGDFAKRMAVVEKKRHGISASIRPYPSSTKAKIQDYKKILVAKRKREEVTMDDALPPAKREKWEGTWEY